MKMAVYDFEGGGKGRTRKATSPTKVTVPDWFRHLPPPLFDIVGRSKGEPFAIFGLEKNPKKKKRKKRKRMPRVVEQVHLYCQKGTSDKEYELILEQDGDTWIVRANYGRRGSVLRPVEKYRGTNRNTAEDEFYEIYEEKIGKGYTVGKRIRNQNTKDKVATKNKATTKPKTPPEPPLERNITLGDL